MAEEFYPKRGSDLEIRIRHLEEALARLSSRLPDATLKEAVGADVQERTSGSPSTPPAAGHQGPNQAPSRRRGWGTRESAIAWDPTDGHNHDGTTSRAVTLTGDVSGTNPANTVDKIKGVAVSAAPGASDDDKFVRYDHGGVQFVYAHASTLVPIGAWGHEDINGTAGVDAELTNTWATSGAISITAPSAGVITTLVVKLSGDVGGAGQNVTVTLYKGGAAQALTATITGGAGTEDEAIGTGSITVAQGDELTCQVKHGGVAPAAVRLIAVPYGYWHG